MYSKITHLLVVILIIPCISNGQILKGQKAPWIEEKYCFNEEIVQERPSVVETRTRRLSKKPEIFTGVFIPTVKGIIVRSYMRDNYGVIKMVPDGGGSNTIRITFFTNEIERRKILKIVNGGDSRIIGVTGEVSKFRGEPQIIVERMCQVATAEY